MPAAPCPCTFVRKPIVLLAGPVSERERESVCVLGRGGGGGGCQAIPMRFWRKTCSPNGPSWLLGSDPVCSVVRLNSPRDRPLRERTVIDMFPQVYIYFTLFFTTTWISSFLPSR